LRETAYWYESKIMIGMVILSRAFFTILDDQLPELSTTMTGAAIGTAEFTFQTFRAAS
jgi:hypothetical protein